MVFETFCSSAKSLNLDHVFPSEDIEYQREYISLLERDVKIINEPSCRQNTLGAINGASFLSKAVLVKVLKLSLEVKTSIFVGSEITVRTILPLLF